MEVCCLELCIGCINIMEETVSASETWPFEFDHFAVNQATVTPVATLGLGVTQVCFNENTVIKGCSFEVRTFEVDLIEAAATEIAIADV